MPRQGSVDGLVGAAPGEATSERDGARRAILARVVSWGPATV